MEPALPTSPGQRRYGRIRFEAVLHEGVDPVWLLRCESCQRRLRYQQSEVERRWERYGEELACRVCLRQAGRPSNRYRRRSDLRIAMWEEHHSLYTADWDECEQEAMWSELQSVGLVDQRKEEPDEDFVPAPRIDFGSFARMSSDVSSPMLSPEAKIAVAAPPVVRLDAGPWYRRARDCSVCGQEFLARSPRDDCCSSECSHARPNPSLGVRLMCGNIELSAGNVALIRRIWSRSFLESTEADATGIRELEQLALRSGRGSCGPLNVRPRLLATATPRPESVTVSHLSFTASALHRPPSSDRAEANRLRIAETAEVKRRRSAEAAEAKRRRSAEAAEAKRQRIEARAEAKRQRIEAAAEAKRQWMERQAEEPRVISEPKPGAVFGHLWVVGVIVGTDETKYAVVCLVCGLSGTKSRPGLIYAAANCVRRGRPNREHMKTHVWRPRPPRRRQLRQAQLASRAEIKTWHVMQKIRETLLERWKPRLLSTNQAIVSTLRRVMPAATSIETDRRRPVPTPPPVDVPRPRVVDVPRPRKLCAHCQLKPARVKFCCDECRKAARRQQEALAASQKKCRRYGCSKPARLKYCSADCRLAVYKERQRQTSPIRCGICGSSGHAREDCMHPAAVQLPSLRTAAVHVRRCSVCGDHMHDARQHERR